jgi:uncharacterized membrane protein
MLERIGIIGMLALWYLYVFAMRRAAVYDFEAYQDWHSFYSELFGITIIAAIPMITGLCVLRSWVNKPSLENVQE